jgi:HEAT repeat protein
VANLTERQVLACIDSAEARADERRLLNRLGTVGTGQSVDLLHSRLMHSPDRRVRVAAVLALRAIGTHAAIEALIDGLRVSDGTVVAFVARALGSINARSAMPALIACLSSDDTCASAHTALTWALFRMPDRAAVNVLTTMLDGRDVGVRKIAAYALAKIESPDAQSVLEEAVENRSWWAGRYARRALRNATMR